MINVITRTHNRPNGYKQNKDMLVKNGLNILTPFNGVNHIVITDDENSVNYIDGDYVFMEKKIEPTTPKAIGAVNWRPYNLYFNQIKHKLKEGWIMYVDDDDRLYDETTLYKILDIIDKNNEDTLIYFQMEYSNGNRLPVDNWNGIPRINQIGGSCFIFHTKYYDDAVWDEWSGGDFRVIEKLNNIIPNKIFIQKPMVYINSIGGGRRQDI
tara:strand:- start:490 stop:1122 length:633 start_codon:yes stop_codon:yes gene_type:complete